MSITSLRNCRSLWLLLWLFTASACLHAAPQKSVITGAACLNEYLPLLQNKRVGVVINQTSVINGRLLADTLISRGIHLKKIFVPEHGFRGVADAGQHVGNTNDPSTGLPVISLYGDNKKPRPEQLKDIDVLIYDLQDVGVRFYTYISTMQYCMEACAENGKQFIVLDRPNPNGNYVDGPVLETDLRSFVGMQPVPVVYGMTAGEYARMLKGEQWFGSANKLNLKVISCKNYDHNTRYELPVPPSPNLRTMPAIYCYPSLCFFEGTVVSVGRGTSKPFEQWGHPSFNADATDSFRPVSTIGATKPPYEGQTCYGKVLTPMDVQAASGSLQLNWLIQAYHWSGDKEHFFTSFFEKLAGTKTLRQQIISGMTEGDIRKSWQPKLDQFKKIRKKYLLYPDFY